VKCFQADFESHSGEALQVVKCFWMFTYDAVQNGNISLLTIPTENQRADLADLLTKRTYRGQYERYLHSLLGEDPPAAAGKA
jgi:hypothetical protein